MTLTKEELDSRTTDVRRQIINYNDADINKAIDSVVQYMIHTPYSQVTKAMAFRTGEINTIILMTPHDGIWKGLK